MWSIDLLPENLGPLVQSSQRCILNTPKQYIAQRRNELKCLCERWLKKIYNKSRKYNARTCELTLNMAISTFINLATTKRSKAHVYISFEMVCMNSNSILGLELWGGVTHTRVSKHGHNCFRWWVVTSSPPSNFLNQCWAIVNWIR